MAEDATSQIFLKAQSKRAQFTGGSFKAWLYTIAEHELIDLHRTTHPAEPLPDDDSRLDPDPGPEDLALRSHDRDALGAALSMLPDEWRRVVHLRSEGYSCNEVAEILGPHRNDAWVRQTHRRALLELRRLLTTSDDQKGGAR